MATNTSAQPKLRIWLKMMYVEPCSAKQTITDRLYAVKLSVCPR